MKVTSQRVALLTGASMLALGLPASAFASPAISHSVNGDNVADEVVINHIGDPPLELGETVDGTSNAFVTVETQVLQSGNAYGQGPTDGYLTFEATNAGDVTIEAIADAVNENGFATARAHTERSIYQSGSAMTKSVLTLDNSGDLAIAAQADAAGTAANANATLSTGILQNAAGPVAQIEFKNQGAIDLTASAGAKASEGSAVALATLYGIDQAAHAYDSGLITLTNAGSIHVGGDAKATGFVTGVAEARVNYGIAQSATGSAADDGYASAALVNSGEIDIGANAAADAAAFAVASAGVGVGIYQHATASAGGAFAQITNSGTMDFSAAAIASAHNAGLRDSTAEAAASVVGIRQTAAAHTSGFSVSSSTSSFHLSQTRWPHGPVAIGLENSGSIALLADAHSSAGNDAYAEALAQGIAQVANGTTIDIGLGNSGQILAGASAEAIGGQMAQAYAAVSGVHQFASGFATHLSINATPAAGHKTFLFEGVGPASVSLTNSGTLDLTANAHAYVTGTALTGTQSWAVAAATAAVGGIAQGAFGRDASALLTNDGTIELSAAAAATGFQTAVAQVRASGFGQGALATGAYSSANWNSSGYSATFEHLFPGDGTAKFANSGAFDLQGAAEVKAGGWGSATIHEKGGNQTTRGLKAEDTFDNAGKFVVGASANVEAGSELGFVNSTALEQAAIGLDAADVSVVNSGTMAVDAIAHGTGLTGYATNIALAVGARQEPRSLGAATASFVNTGLFAVGADAKAEGVGVAFAGAQAAGIFQNPILGSMKAALVNDGEFDIAANASVIADTGAAYASAKATAYYADDCNVIADVTNSGSINVLANVVSIGASGSDHAFAAGLTMFAANHGTSAPAGSMAGTIANSGELRVTAKVDAANGGTNAATATGIYLSSTRDNATVVNSGLIDVEAVTAHGAPANAFGVHLATEERGDPAQAGDKFTFTNDGGTIIVRQSVDGGETWQHGMAIDLSEAPNASVVNLIGDGVIYGNIAVQSGDRIDVKAGTTYFDGIIGPSFKPAGGVTSALLDSGVTGAGTLNIMDGGNLILADARGAANAAMYDGPSYVAVDTFNVASDGTLTLNLAPASGGVQAVGSYVQVYADTANLDGTLVANVTPQDGKFADSTSWQNVIDANTLTGKFAHCLLGGGYADSVLLKLSCSYDSNANVDLSLTRVAFNAVAGLTANEAAVGGGLESAYQGGGAGAATVQSAASAATGSGPFGALVGTLFQLNAADYALALNEMTGAGYAGYLQSFNSLGYHYNSVLDRASECDRPVLAGSALECRTSPFHLWAQLDHDHLDRDGDSELAGDSGHRSTLVAGADVNLSSAAVVGISAGSVSNHDRFADAAGSDIKGDGWQVGAYGVYDPGAFFVKALGTYSRLDGTAHRHLDFGASPGTITGNPDATVWTLGLHGGYRLQLSPANLVTPFVSYDYTDAKLDGFTEAGTTGAELTVNGGSEKHSWLTGGVKWTGQFGGIVPEASVAWRHAFGDRRASFNANFAGSPATSDFDIVSMSEKHDALLAGVSVGGRLGPVDVRLAYQGAFGGGTTEHSGFLKLVLPFKAPSAAPRHASAAAPQPPQQEAATQTCADGTVMLASETCPTLPAPSATPL